MNQIRQRLRDMAVSENTLRKGTREARAAAAAADAPQEELLKTLTQLAVNIHGVFVSKSSPDHPQYDDFRLLFLLLYAKLRFCPLGFFQFSSLWFWSFIARPKNVTKPQIRIKIVREVLWGQK